jgi:hypothetical protein
MKKIVLAIIPTLLLSACDTPSQPSQPSQPAEPREPLEPRCKPLDASPGCVEP